MTDVIYSHSVSQLKQSLESLLFLIDEFVPTKCFENGVEHLGTDEGVVHAGNMIAEARGILFSHMTKAEKENTPLEFNND